MSTSGLYVGNNQGRSNMYMGTTPGVPNLGGNTRRVNQTLGFMSNDTIPYAYTVRRWNGQLEENIREGQFCFVRKYNNEVSKGHGKESIIVNLLTE